MNLVTFKLKRGHLKSVAFGRRVLKDGLGRETRMTPARFDLLYVIRHGVTWLQHAGGRLMSICQRDLRDALDLHASTVSKMVQALRKLGWISVPEVDEDDERMRIVRLTEEGARQIDEASRLTFEESAHDAHFEKALEPHARRSERSVRRVLASVVAVIAFLAGSLRDDATLDYSDRYFRPDEIRSQAAEPPLFG
jgi:DNA-binding MarR family transcriptional regulator